MALNGSSGPCARCQNLAAQICNGCSAASIYGEYQLNRTFYCNSECQKADWKRHKTQCKQYQTRKFRIKPIAGKGQGFSTTSRILKGSCILSEAPIFTVQRDGSNPHILERIIDKKLESLSKNQRQAFFALHNAHGKDYSQPLGITKTNALPLGSEASEGGLFLEASRINHSCRHNAQNTWNANLGTLTIHVFHDVEEGEEITISYLDGSPNFAERQRKLKRDFGFDCACELCSLDPTQRLQSDRRLDEITRLDGLIGDGVGIVRTPVTCMYNAHKLLGLLEDEGIADARVPRLYYDALQIAIAHGDQARAKVFAERAYAARVIVEGEESPETLRLSGFSLRPANHALYGTSMTWKRALKDIPQGLSEQEFENWLWRKKR